MSSLYEGFAGDAVVARVAQLEAQVARLEERLARLESGAALPATSAPAPYEPAQYPVQQGWPAQSDPVSEEILSLVRAGKMIAAIKVYRQQYGVGLKEAKDAVERLR